MQLRPYQSDAISAVAREWDSVPSTLLALPTGCGKTECFAKIAEQRAHLGRILVVAHTRELVLQASARFRKRTNLTVSLEMGEYSESRAPGRSQVVVGSVQTLGRCGRVQKYWAEDWSTLIVDEAHRCSDENGSYTAVIDHFAEHPSHRILGVTATPVRSDKRAIVGPDRPFKSLAFVYPLMGYDEQPSAITDGWLVPIVQNIIHIEGLDYSEVKSSKELSAQDVENALGNEKTLTLTCAAMIDLQKKDARANCIFCATIDHATLTKNMLEDCLASAGLPSEVSIVHGKMDKLVRNEKLNEFARGETDWIVSVDALVEGWDCPRVSRVIICRPTKSQPRYCQMVGRGTRPLPECVVPGIDKPEERRWMIANSAKPTLEVVDFIGSASHLSLLVNVADILARADEKPAVVRAAKEIAYTQNVDWRVALEKARLAQQVHDAELVLASLAGETMADLRKLAVSHIRYSLQPSNPFTGRPNYDTPDWGSRQRGNMLTEKQFKYLLGLGVSPQKAITFSKRQAGAVIDKLVSDNTPFDGTRIRGWREYYENR